VADRRAYIEPYGSLGEVKLERKLRKIL
jgi:hypothetical protein